MNRRIKFLLCFTFAFIFAISGFFMLNGTTTAQPSKAHADTTIDWSTAGSTMEPGLYDDSGNITMDWGTVKKKFYRSDSLLTFSGKNFTGNLVVGDLSSLGEYTSLRELFFDCTKLKSISFTKDFDTSNVTCMTSMFGGQGGMSGRLSGCESAISIDLRSFNTSKVTAMDHMFYGCYKLESLDFSNFDTSNVTNMSRMFDMCNAIKSLDVSNFNTSNVTNMESMFADCQKLTSLDLSNFDTSKVTSMSNMFEGCGWLEFLNLSSFDTKNVTNTYSFFEWTSIRILQTPYNSGTNTVAISVGMYDWDDNSKYYSNYTCLETSHTLYADRKDSLPSRWQKDYTNGTIGIGQNATKITSIKFEKTAPNGYTYTGKNFYTGIEIWTTGAANSPSTDVAFVYSSTIYAASHAFRDLKLCTSITFNNYNTSYITDMQEMFAWNKSLKSLDLSNFDTSNAHTMDRMFNNCSALTELDLSNFDTSNVTSMSCMFLECNSLTELNLSNFDTSKVQNMSGMFNNCNSLKTLDLSSFKTPILKYVCFKDNEGYGMFYNCSSLESLDLSGFNTSKINCMDYMFSGCNSLKTLDMSNIDAQNVTSLKYMFRYCYGLKKFKTPYNSGTKSIVVPLYSGMYDWNDNDKYSLSYTCVETSHTLGKDIIESLPRDWKSDLANKTAGIGIGSDKITSITFETAGPSGYTNTGKSFYTGIEIWTTGSVSEPSTDLAFVFEKTIRAPKSSFNLFLNLQECQSIVFNNFSTTSASHFESMFYNDKKLRTLDLSNFDTSNVTSFGNMFTECSSLESINLLGFNTSNLTDMSNMFYECSSLKSIDLSSFDFSKVTNVGNMFYGYTGIIDFSKFDTTSLKTMRYMFAGYKGENLDLSNLKTDSVTNVEYMFSDYAGTINLSNLDTTNMTTMRYMFCEYKGTTLDLSNFNTTNVTDMSYMFSDCSELTSLNINGLDTSNVTNMAYMFSGCTSLKLLDLSSFNTTKCTDFTYMFGGMTDDDKAIEMIKYVKMDWGDDVPETVRDKKSLIHFYGNMVYGIPEDDLTPEDEEAIWYELMDMYGSEFYDVLLPAVNLETITIGNNFILSDSSNATYMFLGCANLKEIKVVDGQSNTIKISGSINGNSMFKGCKSLPAITFEVVSATSNNSLIQTNAENTGKFSDSTAMFANCTSLEIVDLSQVTLSGSATDMFANCTALKKLVAPAALEGITSIGLPKTMYIESNSYEEIKSDILSKTDKITLTSTPSFVPSTGILLESNILELIFSALIFSFAIGTLIVVLKKSKKNMEKR